MRSTAGTPAGRRLAGDDGWAIFAQPPGERDLALEDYWLESLERSRRRRAARRRPRVVQRGASRASLALAAAALGAPVATGLAGGGSIASASATSLDLHRGATGDAVRAVQRALGITADGVFGPQTLRAVKAFQRAHGLPATGYVGALTTNALRVAGAATADLSPSSPASPDLDAATAQAVQRALGIAADGVVGPQTRAAVRAFQAAHGLTVDGRVGPATLRALGLETAAQRSAQPGAPAPAPAQTQSTSGAQAAVAAAMTRIGAPYRAGATGPSGFDCSGLVTWAMRQAGIVVPRTSFAQSGMGTRVSSSEIRAGDLVFFNTAGAGPSDVGIATSATTAVSATTHGVMVHPILTGYWGQHFVGARRVA